MIDYITPQNAVLLLMVQIALYFALRRKIAAWLAGRVRVLIVPPGEGDILDVPGRLRGDILTYRRGGEDQTGPIAPGVVRRIRRHPRAVQYVIVDAPSGAPLTFPEQGVPQVLHYGIIRKAVQKLGSAALKYGKTGPLAELAPYIPLMLLTVTAMTGAILFASGKGQGWW